MSIVQNRERAHEGSFDPKVELELRVAARCNKLLGLWAAERAGMIGEAAVDYALSLVGAKATNDRDDKAIIKRVCQDMDARGYPITEDDVGRQLSVFATQAQAEVLHGRP
jgi:hypothetical protein